MTSVLSYERSLLIEPMSIDFTGMSSGLKDNVDALNPSQQFHFPPLFTFPGGTTISPSVFHASSVDSRISDERGSLSHVYLQGHDMKTSLNGSMENSLLNQPRNKRRIEYTEARQKYIEQQPTPTLPEEGSKTRGAEALLLAADLIEAFNRQSHYAATTPEDVHSKAVEEVQIPKATGTQSGTDGWDPGSDDVGNVDEIPPAARLLRGKQMLLGVMSPPEADATSGPHKRKADSISEDHQADYYQNDIGPENTYSITLTIR